MRLPALVLGLASAVVAGVGGRVVLIQDAGIDDYMCTVLLSRFEGFAGEVVVNADSSLPSSVQAADKLHSFLPREIALSLSRARMFNAFPWEYRVDSKHFLALPGFADVPNTVKWPFQDGDQWLHDYLSANTNVTVVITTAPTPLVTILKRTPALLRSVTRIVWMAGAIDVDGNLDPKEFPWENSKAEWNVFTDPEAAAELLNIIGSEVELLLFPLDIANQTPLNKEFYDLLQQSVNASPEGSQQRKLREIVLQGYTLVKDQPYYRLWDTVAAGYLIWPELYAPLVSTRLEVVTVPENMGWLRRCTAASARGACIDAKVAFSFASDAARQQFIRNVASA